jgi:serine/threonine-protein kinase
VEEFVLNLDVSAPRVVDRQYELVELLGLGSMGEVWRARHLGLGQTCAVKLIACETHETPHAAHVRFTREARIAAALSRKTRHIVSVTDFGSDESGAYLVMELLDGETLDTRLARGCTPREIGSIVSQIAKGLGVAHREGILHRDVKPANVFLARTEDGELLAKVLDFGIARLMIGSMPLTVNGVVVGSPAYMSPEHALGDPLDARADVWSLAVVAFEALTGALPFAGETIAATLGRITSIEPTPLRDVFAGATPALEAFFARAFANNIDDRFQNATELARAFSAAVAPRPPRGVRRHRLRFAAIAAACSATLSAGAMLVARSSSSNVAPVGEARVLAATIVAPTQAPPVETRLETPPPTSPTPTRTPTPPPTSKPASTAKPVTKAKPIVDPSSIF